MKTSEELFWQKVNKTSNCWLWQGCIQNNGYGKLSRNGKSYLAHRFSYELVKGEIPKRLKLDHLCRNRLCVNPEHLEPVTQRENLLRGETIPSEHSKKNTLSTRARIQ